MTKCYFISGIGTNVGKTFCSAILTEALRADYWKPVQSGIVEGSDLETVKGLVSNMHSVFHPEAYRFAAPVSPHLAAAIEGDEIYIGNIHLPLTENKNLLIEGAGGLLVPLNQKAYVIDLAKNFQAEIILVVRGYLGCINHTLLSLDYLIRHQYSIKGIILNGEFDDMVKQSILSYADIPLIAHFPEVNAVSKEKVKELSTLVNTQLFL
jgi:dethiobiotin synthetase